MAASAVRLASRCLIRANSCCCICGGRRSVDYTSHNALGPTVPRGKRRRRRRSVSPDPVCSGSTCPVLTLPPSARCWATEETFSSSERSRACVAWDTSGTRGGAPGSVSACRLTRVQQAALQQAGGQEGLVLTRADLGAHELRAGGEDAGVLLVEVDSGHRRHVVDVVVISEDTEDTEVTWWSQSVGATRNELPITSFSSFRGPMAGCPLLAAL
ncbi:hypothetical protein EYF80_031264 [Liparis tanakae]|uniref:Uncharacterized protein n=1 Tax=Liparis tanakae TaxID=230148 RepID=A0A4Z2H0X2_9TELE|nr:hypothetical protein EYF80_031264 [Liparis tanakae]